MRVIDYFDRGVSLGPERPCLVSRERSISFAEVQRKTHQFSKALWSEGLTHGEKAAVISPNAVEAFECVLGIFRAELTWVPVNYRNAADENVHILNTFDVAILFYHSATADQVEVFRQQCPGLHRFICIDRKCANDEYLETWLSGGAASVVEPVSRHDDIVTISPTGGTTGKSKGVMWNNLTWQTFVASQIAALPTRTPPVHLVVAPMTHAAGVFAIIYMSVGGTNVILPGFDAANVIDAIGRYRVSHLFLPPTAIYGLLAHEGVRQGNYRSLQYFVYSAAPISIDKLRQAVEVFGPCMTTFYGQVEAPASLTYMPPWELVEDGVIREDRVASCGRRTLLTRVEIMDDDGRILAANTPGEIVCQGNLVMRGYYKNEAATNEVSRHGWHHTGDVGYFNDAGYLFIIDRKKDMIITGGFNVYPNEVEQVLSSYPAVQDCAVIGVPDEKWGEAVHAIVELKAGCTPDAESLLKFLKEKLGGVKAPKAVDFLDRLPRTGAGKISKKDLRAKYWAGAGRSI